MAQFRDMTVPSLYQNMGIGILHDKRRTRQKWR